MDAALLDSFSPHVDMLSGLSGDAATGGRGSGSKLREIANEQEDPLSERFHNIVLHIHKYGNMPSFHGVCEPGTYQLACYIEGRV